MKKLNNENLKLGVQKKGRLTEEAIDFLRSAGLGFESYGQRLFSTCRNFPLEIIYVRDDDIPDYVESGAVDLGIAGLNLINEVQPRVTRLLNLGFGYCSLCLTAPKESNIVSPREFEGKTIATSYPNSTKAFFEKINIKVKIMKISGSVEITPILGIAQGVVDIVSTGSTLALNDLRVVEKLYNSEAILLANSKSIANPKKQKTIDSLLMRLKGVLAAKNYKYVMMNAPQAILAKIKKTTPGLKSPTISPLATPGWISIQTVIQEDIFWETIEKLKALGASDILVLPIEKLIV
ncbi:ATP phosphoribosyltransferase [Candidatus Roizmanbacteria bacterium]|nr:ATP phosphoribosyltransferase [Candidatus Roizmanbacteria bacterium]